MSVLTVALLLVVLGLLFKYHWDRRHLYLLSSKIDGPLGLPLLGNALEFFCKNEDLFDRSISICSKYASPFRMWFGPKFVLIFTNVIQVEKIMSSLKFAHKDEVYRFMKPANGEGLITGSGTKWKNDRRLIAPLFHHKKMADYIDVVNRESDVFVKDSLKDEAKRGQNMNIINYLHRYSANVISEIIMGVNPKAQNGNFDSYLHNVNDLYVMAHARILKVWLQPDEIFFRTKIGKRMTDGVRLLHSFYWQALKTVKSNHVSKDMANNNVTNSYHETKPERTRPILDHMLDILDEIPSFATDEELVHHLSTFYTAAEDTVATISAFTLLLFGMYPEIQAKAADEVVNVLGKQVRNIEYKELDELKYLDMCIKDVLRLFPIAPFIMRQTQEPVQMDKWSIPAKCSVVVSIHTIHRDPAHWAKPNEFYPEHFLPDAVSKRHPYAFMPFSAGPRGCIGKVLAYMAMKAVIAKILQTYRIEADGTLQDLKLCTDISVRSRNGYHVRLRNIEES